MCAYIVLKFNNKYSLLLFHISCVLIYSFIKFNNKYSLLFFIFHVCLYSFRI